MASIAPLATPPLTRASTVVLPLSDKTPSFIIGQAKKSYKHQYSNIYFVRLRLLREVVEKRAKKLWEHINGNPVLIPRVLEVTKSHLCYVVGTVYMDMPLKPNVMEDIARDNSIPPPPPPLTFYSPDDNVMLEDESGRIRLVGDRLKDARLVTGVIIGALGMETPNGDFEVVDICCAEMAPRPSASEGTNSAGDEMDVDDQTTSPASDEWIGVVSGLDVGSLSPSDAQIQMLVEYLTGEVGGVEQQISSAQISRLIIAGDSLATIAPSGRETVYEDKKARRYGNDVASFSRHPILNLSAHLLDLALVMPIHILPGESDPSGVIMPQQPLPRAMFGEASKLTTFSCETNPTYLKIATSEESPNSSSAEPNRPVVERTLLINSGQPLNDIFKYLPSPPHTRLSILESTIRWRHMAPTAPDTLWCHPYFAEDPFLISETPDIYIVGGQKAFGTKLLLDNSKEAEEKGSSRPRCRIVMIPSFARTGTLVLVNLRSLDVRRVNFAVQGMTGGGEKTWQEKTTRSPSPTPAEPLSSAPPSSHSPEPM